MWVLRGLRNGVLTTRWPARRDEYATATRGQAMVLSQSAAGSDKPATGAVHLADLCPTGAIGQDPGRPVRIDRGGCISCGRCVAARPDVFGWTTGPHGASLSRTGLIVPPVAETLDRLAAVSSELRAKTSALRRSVHLRHVDAGSDGSEEWEIMALLNPVYDIHRLGMFFTASPRHADVLLVTGAGARGMTEPLCRAYDAMPHPKLVVAVGTDAVSGGIVAPSYEATGGAVGPSYAATGGVGDTVPVDVWLPGSPPSPFAILSALLLAVGRLPAAGSRR